jgi:hypothetical protein
VSAGCVGCPATLDEHRCVGVDTDGLLEQVSEPEGEDAGAAAAVEKSAGAVEPDFLREDGFELWRVRRSAGSVVGGGALEDRRVASRHETPSYPERETAPVGAPLS